MKGALLVFGILLIISCSQNIDPEVLPAQADRAEADQADQNGPIEVTTLSSAPPTPRESSSRAQDTAPPADAQPLQEFSCGDGVCTGTENSCSCATDCGTCETQDAGACASYTCTALGACVRVEEPACCGDGICAATESCDRCMLDCCTTDKTLADFPKIATSFTVIVGKQAPASDIVTAANLAAMLKQLGISIGETKLDSEVQGLSERDYLVVGSPCDNVAAAELLGIAKHKNPCTAIPKYEGQIRLIATGESRIALLITGANSDDVARAAKRLSNYQDRPLKDLLVTT